MYIGVLLRLRQDYVTFRKLLAHNTHSKLAGFCIKMSLSLCCSTLSLGFIAVFSYTQFVTELLVTSLVINMKLRYGG